MSDRLPQPRQPMRPSEELLAALVAFDTTSRNSNLALLDFVAAHLGRHGVGCELVHDGERRKANLFASLGEGPRPGLILSGHTDVVPVDGQSWSSDPFRLSRRGDRLYGRGACDMKGFIAVVLAKVEAILAAGLPCPIHIALSYDEEVGCLGVRSLLARLAARGLTAEGCIVGEPTAMVPVAAHKGKRAYRCHVHGKAAHSSLRPMGVNAVEHAARVIVHLSDLAERLEQGPRDEGFDVPYTTLCATTVSGGMTANTIPADCGFTFEYRFLPGSDPEAVIADLRRFVRAEVEPAMRRHDPALAVDLEEIVAYPPLGEDGNGPLLARLRRWTGEEQPRKVAFGSEAGLYAEAGFPAVVCGPGDIRQAHRPDEYVEAGQLARCEDFIDAMIAELAAER